jgi:hypothetical protein
MKWTVELPCVAAPQRAPVQPHELWTDRSAFALHVVFTTWPGTLAALQMAARQSRSLGARIVIWFFEQVPRQFTTASPPISTKFLKRRLQAMARKCCPGVESQIRICLCTDQWQSMRTVFTPESVVLAGGRKRWWGSREQRTVTLLRSHGCRVLFVSTERAVPGMERKRAKAN